MTEYIYVHVGNSLYKVESMAYLAAKILLSYGPELDAWVIEVGVKVSHDKDPMVH